MRISVPIRHRRNGVLAALAAALPLASATPAAAQTENRPPVVQAPQPAAPETPASGGRTESKEAPPPASTPAPPPAVVPPTAPPAPPPAATVPSPVAPPPPQAQKPADHGTPATVVDSNEVDGILGKPARSPTGEDMGRIVDLIIDRSGQIRAAIIDFGGFLGVGSRKIAVDWRAVRFNAGGKADNLIVDLTRNQLRMAPAYIAGEPVVVIGPQQEAKPPAAPAADAPPPKAPEP